MLGGLLLPGKKINNSFADARGNIAEESSLHQIVESKNKKNKKAQQCNASILGFESKTRGKQSD